MKKHYCLTIALTIIALSLFSVTTYSQTNASQELLIWTKKDFGTQGVEEIALKFKTKYGVTIRVEEPTADDPTPLYNRQAVLGRGPDIFLRAHDRIGELAEAELIEVVTPSKETLQKIGRNFWDAVRYNGKYYGFPITVEGVTQICNTALQARPFSNIAEIKRQAYTFMSRGIKPLLWDYYDNYFSYGFITSEGGYSFEFNNGSYNPGKLGVDNQGAIAGVKAVKSMLDNNLLPSEIDYGVFDSAFKEGKAACIINGPWSWKSYADAGIKMSIGPLPSVGSGTPRVFSGVLVALINPASQNKEQAQRFIEEYLLSPDGLAAINTYAPLGAVTHTAYMNILSKENPLLADAYKVWEVAEPMPNISKISKYWTHMDTALIEIYQSNKDPKKALSDAANRIAR